MPIYEYQCKACSHALEVLQKMSEDPLTDCPSCGEAQLRKKVSAVAFRLKGSGWYETDFKTGDKKNIAGDKSPDSSSGSSKEGGGDSAKKTATSDSSSSKSSKSDKSSTAAAS